MNYITKILQTAILLALNRNLCNDFVTNL